MLIVAELHSDPSDGETPVLAPAKFRHAVLVPTMNVRSTAETIQRAAGATCRAKNRPQPAS
ncbi:hypothetical protein [Mesorhizobium sp. M0772]|uniref:hypothetical protein n=1 Tax=Mesorhizobium sp. M0772 TaxID=2956998 RepID=UPI00333D9539